MDPNTEHNLRDILAVTKENNELLHRLIVIQKRAQIIRLVYWGLLIALALGSFYFLEPYLGSVLNFYTGGVSGMNTLQDVKKSLDSGEINNLIKELNQ